MDDVRLLVGLGNPEARYLFTRHNVGFMVLDLLGKGWGVKIDRREYNSLFGVSEDGIYLIKPQTYMNASGRAMKEWMQQGFLPDEMLVIHDDIDLELGRVRIKRGGGAGGHRGLESIIQSIGTGDFPRVRVGVGRPPGREHQHEAIVDFLLSPFTNEQEDSLVGSLRLAVQIVETILRKGLNEAMNIFNKRDKKLEGGDSSKDASDVKRPLVT
jgi:PTH1 family peptidyl-tRNA hydrolase